MLHLIIGKAKSGKTGRMYEEICRAVKEHVPGRYLIVPEQYSHEAERELCRVSGDELSRFAEVVSFTAFARRIAAEMGGFSTPYLDKGGKLLCMALAAKNAESRLELYRAAAVRPELQSTLLAMNDRLKTACMTPDRLLDAAGKCEGELRKKLNDLALLSASYDAVLGNAQADPADRLSVLARQIPGSSLGPRNAVYVDGFMDFTAAELSVLHALLKQQVELTVCLTLDELHSRNEIYALSRSSAQKLLAMAQELGTEADVDVCLLREAGEADPLQFFADHIFSYTEEKRDAEGRIALYRPEDLTAECELAAAKALELVRTRGCRWRDIAIAARGFADYAGTLGSCFEEYGVPLFIDDRPSIAARPLPCLISGAFALFAGGWQLDDMLSYLDTGLTGLTREQCDLLAGYIYRWNLTERAWHSDAPWHQHPDGYGAEENEESAARLAEINALRSQIATPLLQLEAACHAATRAGDYARALAQFLEDLHAAETLEQHAADLVAAGREADAEEYSQLWDVVVSALEQVHAILGEQPMEQEEFVRLFSVTLARYDVGRIPASLDAVSAGDLDRMRRRNLRYLIFLGASDDRLPAAAGESGLFSEDELRTLDALGAGIGESPDTEMWREYALIYNTVSLPSKQLILSCPRTDESGNPLRPSLVMTRAEQIFSLREQVIPSGESRMAALRPALRLAASGAGAEAAAARKYFARRDPETLERILASSEVKRGSLSPESVEALYGRRLRLSASQADSYYACRWAYFCRYGLKLHARAPSEFDASQLGLMTHEVLQHTAQEVQQAGGFAAVGDAALQGCIEKQIRRYEAERLPHLAEKTPRFLYLFRRMEKDIVRVATDTAQELRQSDFVPLAFELNLGMAEHFPPLRLGSGKDILQLSGIVDRVDGWESDGVLYLRVDDYKTGKKKFSLSDIWYGLSMQMLLYLFALLSGGSGTARLLGADPALQQKAAGVEYIPAHDPFLSADGPLGEEETETLRHKELRRTGLVLQDSAVWEAWEHGGPATFSPVTLDSSGNPKEGTVATEEQFALLFAHIQQRLTQMAEGLRSGEIPADPYEKTPGETACTRCDYADTCGFADGENGEAFRPTPPMKSDEVWEKMRKEMEVHG